MTRKAVTHTTFVIERDLPASPERVFAAFADQKAKDIWFAGPSDWRTPVSTFDFRVGGRETSIGGPVDGFTTAFEAVYLDIVENERIIYAYEMHLDGKKLSDSLATFELTPVGDKTHVKLTEQGAFLDGLENPDDREQGTHQMFDSLEAYLKSQVGA